MAALASITAVRPTINTQVQLVKYGATIAAGQPLYFDTTDSEYKLADNNASTITATVVGISMTPGVDGGYGYMAISGSIILVGTTAAVGETYYVGATAGEIVPDADVASGNYIARIGTAETTTQIKLAIEYTGVAHA